MKNPSLNASPNTVPELRRLRVAAALLLMAAAGCGGGSGTEPEPDPDPDPDPPTYGQRVTTGWASLTAGSYASGRASFLAAIGLDPAPAEAHTGLGWCELKLDDPDAAHTAFATGITGTGTDAMLADLYAGWAFAWSARQTALDRHAESNARVAEAEARDAAWSFGPLPGLDSDDLSLLAAANFFALGAFDSSLARVRTLDPAFTADVGTAAGQAALAARIEALRTGSP
ncbi:hypothetical protein K8I85_19500 [bacterium]|nr:hypothetical protein [bacterium]